MRPTDVTVRILGEIRDEIRQTNARLDQTNARLDQTNAGLEEVRDDLGRRITDSEMRTATAINALAGTMGQVRDLLEDRLDLKGRVERCENEIERIKARLSP